RCAGGRSDPRRALGIGSREGSSMSVRLSGQDVSPDATPRTVRVTHTRSDRIYRRVAASAGVFTFILLALIGIFLFIKAWPAFQDAGWSFFTTQEWVTPPRGNTYGVAALLYWTAVIAVIALVIALPVSVACALFINEYAPRRLKGALTSLIDLLAAV